MSYVGLADDCGSRSQFYRVVHDKKMGFKSFRDKKLADFAYGIQKTLAQYNDAPKVYGEVGRIRFCGELTDWGYLTEIARPMKQCWDDDCDGECYRGSCENSMKIQSVLHYLSRYHGLEYSDAHSANFGYIRRDKTRILVPIDFGVESFSDMDDMWATETDFWNLRDYCGCTACREECYA